VSRFLAACHSDSECDCSELETDFEESDSGHDDESDTDDERTTGFKRGRAERNNEVVILECGPALGTRRWSTAMVHKHFDEDRLRWECDQLLDCKVKHCKWSKTPAVRKHISHSWLADMKKPLFDQTTTSMMIAMVAEEVAKHCWDPDENTITFSMEGAECCIGCFSITHAVCRETMRKINIAVKKGRMAYMKCPEVDAKHQDEIDERLNRTTEDKAISKTERAKRWIQRVADLGNHDPAPRHGKKGRSYLPFIDRRSVYRRYTLTDDYTEAPISFNTFRKDAWPEGVHVMSGSELKKCSVCTLLKRGKLKHGSLASYGDNLPKVIADIDEIQDAHATWHMEHRIYYHEMRVEPRTRVWCICIDSYDRRKSHVPRNPRAAWNQSAADKAMELCVVGVHAHQCKPRIQFYVFPSVVFGHDCNMQIAVLLKVLELLKAKNPLPSET
jgi:hypothetical protein